MCYLDGVKSATLAFHYSAGNNFFIKLEQWLELAKGVSVIEKLYGGRDAARVLAGLRGLPADAVAEFMKSAFYWSRFAGERGGTRDPGPQRGN